MKSLRQLMGFLPVLIFVCFTRLGFADQAYISVGNAKANKTVLALAAPKALATLSAVANQISSTLYNDLQFMDIFRFIANEAFLDNSPTSGITLGSFKMTDWSSIGVEFLVKSAVTEDESNLLFEVHVFEVNSAKEVLSKRFIGPKTDLKTIAHTAANEIVRTLTGLPGVFLTKIVSSCGKKDRKELYIMDYDGTNVKQVTFHKSNAFAPAWSPAGDRIAYSLVTKRSNNVRNIDLWELSFATNTVRRLSNRMGINSGAAYSPDGTAIAMTMSFLGNPEIFALRPEAGTVTQLTKSFGFDVDPTWSPDGKWLAFVSSRTGMPMVYKMASDGNKLQRLTYAGRYNATPSWSPQGDRIAFAGWIDNLFDIFLMDVDGKKIERLTKAQGNNEDPSFSPDGNFIVFSSNRAGGKNLYVMNVDGTFVKRLTYGLGDCVAPKWSLPPK